MDKTRRYSGAMRVRKAYLTALRVISGYALLALGRRIFGQQFYDKRIGALHLRNALRVKNAILELDGLFIKVGQLLSILSNFVPEAFQKPLEELQDQVPARPIEEVRARFLREFGKAPEVIFKRFDAEPLASASIGQAHRALLPDGTEVVVKVQHADIEDIAKVDLQIIRRLTQVISWIFGIKGMDHLYTQVRKMIEEELDFHREAASMQIIAENLKNEPGIFIPKVHETFSTGRVLTTSWHSGVKISNIEQIDDWQLDRPEIATRLIKAYCKMVFQDGFYHADPHPGNILIQQDGGLVLLDFGATGRLSQTMREGIPRLIESAVKNDTQAMIDACRQMGFIADGREAQQMAEKMINALRNFLQNEVQFEGLNFKDIKVDPFENSLINLIREIGIGGISGTVQVPKDYVLLNRMLTLLLGICNTIAPQLNPLDVVRPYAQQLVVGEKGDVVGFVKNFLKNTLTNAITLPDDLRKVLHLARSGQLEMLNPDVRSSARLLYLAVQQALFAVLALVFAAGGFWLQKQGNPEYMRYAWIAAAAVFLLFLRALRKGSRLFRTL